MRFVHGDSNREVGNGPAVAVELQIRRLTAADLPTVQGIHSRIPIQDRSEAWDTFVSWYAAACHMGTFGPDWECSVLAEWRSEPAGFLLMHRDSRSSQVLRSHRIMVAAVDPAHWRKGIGREMADAAAEFCRQRGIQVIQSIVPDGRPGHSSFLEHCGFSVATRRMNPNGVRVYEKLLR